MDFYDLTWRDVATAAFVMVAFYFISIVWLCL